MSVAPPVKYRRLLLSTAAHTDAPPKRSHMHSCMRATAHVPKSKHQVWHAIALYLPCRDGDAGLDGFAQRPKQADDCCPFPRQKHAFK